MYKSDIPVYHVRKIIPDDKIHEYSGKFMQEKDINMIVTSDADVYTEDGKLLLRFRKNVLPTENIEKAHDAMKTFINKISTDRGIAAGSKEKSTGHKIPVRSNILGYFDKWSISQKSQFKKTGIKMPGPCRVTKFTATYPDKWKQIIPLIKDIDSIYKLLCPKEHLAQYNAAISTPFHISDTAFSTVTTNLNFQTALHKDSGDFKDGFGNLVVIEKGTAYSGAYTGFPQYGVAVDCRTGDFLAMNVHELHGNTPLILGDETSKRISLVSYLRDGIVSKAKDQEMYDPIALKNEIQSALKLKKV